MVSFSKEDLCGDVSNKQPLENGHIPKYKPRKVSVRRDFPPQCGPNFVPINVETGENSVGATEVVNPLEVEGGGSSTLANMMEVEGVKTSEMSKVDKICEIKLSRMGNVVGSSGVKTSNIALKSSMDVHEVESLDALVERVAASADRVQKMLAGIGTPETRLHNKADGQTHKSVNDPIQVKRDEHEDALIGQVAMTKNGLLNNAAKLITKTSPIGVDLPNNMKSNSTKSGSHTLSKGINEAEGLSLIQNPSMEEAKYWFDAGASFRPMDKFCQRRVSVVRDLPPNCGTNIKLLESTGRDLPPKCGTYIKLPVSVVRDLPPNCGTNIKLPESTVLDLPPKCGTNIKLPVSVVHDLPLNCGTNIKLPEFVRDLPPSCQTNIKQPVSAIRDLPPNYGTEIKSPLVSSDRDLHPNYGINIKLPPVSVVRDLPPNCGTNIKSPPVSIVRDLPPSCLTNIKLQSVSVDCDLTPNYGTNIKLPVSIVCDLPPNCRTNIKLPVYVVRDLSPNCEPYIKLPMEGEKHLDVLEGDCLNNSEEVEVKPQSTIWGNGSREALRKILVTSNKECRNVINEVHVHKKIVERLSDEAGRGALAKNLSGNVGTIISQEIMEATVESGLIDFEECNTGLEESSIKTNEGSQSVPVLGAMSKGMVDSGTKDTGGRVGKEIVDHSVDSNDEVGARWTNEGRQSVPVLGAMSKGTVDSGTKDIGGRVGKETVNHSVDSNDEVGARCRDSLSGNESRREVVHCLMAASYCPWRKGKGKGNTKKEKRKRKQKHEAECLGQLFKKRIVTSVGSY